jgi:hypothetical protein
MAISSPLDIFEEANFICTRFEILSSQNISQTGGGAQPVVQVGLDLWTGDWETRRPLKPNAFDRMKALMHSLQGSALPFWGRDTTRCRPIGYPGVETPGDFSGILDDVNANNKQVTITGLPSGYKAKAGDFFAFSSAGNRYYHQILEDQNASGGSLSNIEVRPHISPNWVDGSTVDFLKPKMRMKLIPGSLRMDRAPSGFGTIAFSGIQILKDS